MKDSDDFSEIDCDHVLSGAVGQAVMVKSITKEFLTLDPQKQARLLSNIKLWADGHNPHSEQFQGNEGRCGGKNDRMLAAVKVHKVRLYGFVRRYKNIKTLFIVDIDAAKKQNKANRRNLARAQRAVDALDILIGD